MLLLFAPVAVLVLEAGFSPGLKQLITRSIAVRLKTPTRLCHTALRQSHSAAGASLTREKGDLYRALQDYDEALQLNSSYATAFNNWGFAYSRKGDFEIGSK